MGMVGIIMENTEEKVNCEKKLSKKSRVNILSVAISLYLANVLNPNSSKCESPNSSIILNLLRPFCKGIRVDNKLIYMNNSLEAKTID